MDSDIGVVEKILSHRTRKRPFIKSIDNPEVSLDETEQKPDISDLNMEDVTEFCVKYKNL